MADEQPGLGPLGGIATALMAAAGHPVLLVAWDMPFVTGELLAELRSRGERGACAVVPVLGTEEWYEPLCAWYAAEALDTCRALLAAGVRRAAALVEALPDAQSLGEAVLAQFGDPARLFTSVDTPGRLAELGGASEIAGA